MSTSLDDDLSTPLYVAPDPSVDEGEEEAAADAEEEEAPPVHVHKCARRSACTLLLYYLMLVLVPVLTGVLFLLVPLNPGSDACAGEEETEEGGEGGGGHGEHPDPEKPPCRSVTVAAYILIHQGLYALFAGCIITTQIDVAFPTPLLCVAEDGSVINELPADDSDDAHVDTEEETAAAPGSPSPGCASPRPRHLRWIVDRRQRIITCLVPVLSVLIVWAIFTIAWLVKPTLINAPFTHTIGPFIISFVVILRYAFLSFNLYEMERKGLAPPPPADEEHHHAAHAVHMRPTSMSDASVTAAGTRAVNGSHEAEEAATTTVAKESAQTEEEKRAQGSDTHKHPHDAGATAVLLDSRVSLPSSSLSSSYWRSKPFRQLRSVTFLLFLGICTFFFCQADTLWFRDLQHSPLRQFLSFALFIGVMSVFSTINARVGAQMDGRRLLGATAHTAQDHPGSRPEYAACVAGLMCWCQDTYTNTHTPQQRRECASMLC
jgi:hypothetical protein